MPPKSSRRRSQVSQNSPDSEGLGEALEQLCMCLEKGKSKKGHATAPTAVKNIETILKSYRKKSQKVHNDVLKIIVAAMDDGGGAEFCSQMEPSVFCIALDIMLQADICPDNQAQRGISYLSASLHQDSNDKDVEHSVRSRKESIGKECLARLIAYFSDTEKDDPTLMRRWVGILIIELIQASDENIETASFCPDDERRGIARVMLNDPDEHVQIIAAELIKTLVEGGMDLEDIWPDGEESYYAEFPLTSSSRSGWVKTFSQWLENVYVENPQLTPKPLGEVVYVESIELEPEIRFGAPGRMAVLSLVEDTLSILTPRSDGNMIQILEIFLSCFKSAHTLSDESSQLHEVRLTLELDTDSPIQAFLDANAIHLDAIIVTVNISLIEPLIEAIKVFSPEIEILGPSQEDELDLLDTNVPQVMQVFSAEIMQRRSSNSPLEYDVKECIQEIEISREILSQDSSICPKEVPLNNKDEAETSDDFIPPRKAEFQVATAEIIHQRKSTDIPPNRKPKIENNVNSRPNSAVSQAMQPRAGSQEAHELKEASQPVQEQRILRNRKEGSRVANETEESVDPVTTKQTSRIITYKKGQKSKIKVIAKKPLVKQAKASESISKGKKEKPNEKKEIPKPKDVFDIRVDEDDELISPHVTTLKGSSRDSKSQKSQDAEQHPALPRKKKYSLHGHAKESPLGLLAADPYTIPEDDGGDKKKEANGKIPKGQVKSYTRIVASAGKIVKGKNLNGPAKPKPKRQSAPAKMAESIAPARESQRVAAAKAKQKIYNLDDSDNEFEKKIVAYVSTKLTPKSKPKTNTSKKESQATTNTAILDNSISARIVPKSKVEKKAGKFQGENVTSPSKDNPIKKVSASKESLEKIISTERIEPANSSPIESDAVLQNPEKSDARLHGLMIQDSTSDIVDGHLDVNPETESASLFPIKPVATEEIIKPVHQTRTTVGESFADRLGSLLGEIPDVRDQPELKVFAKVTGSTVDIPTAKSFPDRDSPPITSPFPPSSSIIEQNFPITELYQDIPKNQTNQNSCGKTTGIADQRMGAPGQLADDYFASRATQSNQEKPLEPTLSQQTDKATQQVTDEIRIVEFSTPGIPIKHAAPQVESKEQASDVRTRFEVPIDLSSWKIKGENRATQTTAEVDIPEDAGEPMSSNNSQAEESIEQPKHSKEAQKKRKSATNLNIESKRRHTGAKRDSQTDKDNFDPTPNPKFDGKLKLSQASPNLPKCPERASDSSGKDPSRRPKIIAFDKQGARNQGQSIANKMAKGTTSTITASGEVAKRKRKRVAEASIDTTTHSPPKKRLHSSPVRHEDFSSQLGDDYVNTIEHSMKENSPAVPSDRHRSRFTRQSSQLSRIDKNGSPIATGKIDHIGELKKRLGSSIYPKSPHDQQSDTAVDSHGEDEIDVFAPRVQLSLKNKVRRSPQDEEVTSRYIAHEKISDKQYRGIQTQALVAPEAGSVDPFVEPTNKLTPFIERLQGAKSRYATKTRAQDHIVGLLPSQPQARPVSPLLPPQERRGNQSAELNRTRQGPKQKHSQDLEKTLVNSDRQHEHQGSPDDMTNGSSPESRSSGHSARNAEDSVLLTERWNVAIRPHYTNFHDAVHRIADEVIVRLADEEDRIRLVAKQYDENGTTLLQRLMQKREREKSTILQGLESESETMKTAFTKSRENVQERAQELKENPINVFEKEWKKKQDEIQKMIAGSMDAPKG